MEVVDLAGNPDAKGSQKANNKKSKKKGKRGRKKIPPQWTRIICFDDIEDYEIQSYELNIDLQDVVSNPLKP